jgi:hypothetical protein
MGEGLIGVVTQKQSDLQSELNRLAEVVSGLDDRINLLSQKLSPVSRPSLPTSTDCEKDTEPGTELGKALRIHSNELRKLFQKVDDMQFRLEL